MSDSDSRNQTRPSWYETIKNFERADLRKAIFQIANTLIPYLVLWYIMVRILRADYPYWVVLLLAVPAGLFMVRLFIIFHDCTHGSFLASKKANRIVGFLLGIITYTPYGKWGASHWRHHATVANLDRRGSGDFWTMTKEEYLKSSKWVRGVYRFARNPFVAFILGPLFAFPIAQRLPIRYVKKNERNSIYFANLGILVMILIAGFALGFGTYFLIQIPILFVGGMAGFWLFYVQHNFEGVYWARQKEWDRLRAALEGSSYYKLPKILQWFTGNIGYHHIHHVRPLIPNYNLEACFNAEPGVQEITPLNLLKSLRSLRLHLWDETNQQLVGFGALRNAGTK